MGLLGAKMKGMCRITARGTTVAMAAFLLLSGIGDGPGRLMAQSGAARSGNLFERPSANRAAEPSVVYLYPGQANVAAGRSASLELHFRVAPGLHINSHRPLDKFLIPATLTFPEGSGVRLVEAVYPSGSPYTSPLDGHTRLDVYSGDFVVQAKIVASPGAHLVEAVLRYQACDNSQCQPPRKAVAAIDVVGK